MIPILFAIISGAAMSLQGVFNTKLGEKICLWETTVLVQGIALISALIVSFIFGKGNYRELQNTNKLYLLGGILGIIITFTVMKSISGMGATCGIAIILVSQLLTAALINAFGLFGSEKISFGFKEILGIAIMIVGIVVFKWKH